MVRSNSPLPELLSVALTNVFVPSLKVTEPVGIPDDPAALTVTVKLTGWFSTEGLTDEVTVTIVPPFLTTVSLSGTEGLPTKLVSPL